MTDSLLLGLAIIGALSILRGCWKLGKVLTAAWRLRKAVLQLKQSQRDALGKMSPIWARNQAAVAMVAKAILKTQQQTTSHPWSKEEQDGAN